MSETAVMLPMVVDLGKQRRSRIKDLKRGRGKLIGEVDQVMERVQAELGVDAAGKQFVPVVIVFEKKSKKRRGFALPLPFP